MFGRLFGRRGKEAPPLPRIPDGTRLYAIGDIHGRVDLLRQLHDLVCGDAAAAAATRNLIVYLGDYIDRGGASREVIECLLDEPLAGFTAYHLLGNHEDCLLQFLTDANIGPSWLAFGGRETLKSYGVKVPTSDLDLRRAQDALHEKLPSRHLSFLRRLALSHVEGDYFFVHAGVRPGVALSDQAPQDMLWIREEFLEAQQDFGKIVVHGHSITEEPDARRNRIGIDTGAYASGRLTCLVLEGDTMAFLHT